MTAKKLAETFAEPPDVRRRRAKTEAILNAAARLFASDGYRETSLGDVAAQVDLTPKALYHYYPSKHDLLDAVLTRAFRYFEASQLEAARPNWSVLSLREALVESSMEAMSNLLEQGDLLRVSFSETFHGSERTQRRHEEYQENWTRHVACIVAAHDVLGSTAERDFAEHLVATLFGTAVDVILRPRPHVARGKKPVKAYIERIVDNLLHGVLPRSGNSA